MLLLLSPIRAAWAQAQNANWQFGLQAGLTFSGANGPTPSLSAVNSFEACTSLSDSLGTLLCYSDGANVFDRTHAIMPNGAAGSFADNKSASQGGLLVRQPGRPAYCYLFTVDAAENSLADGFRYSVVDLRLRGGLGDVLPAQKRVAVSPGILVTEKLTAVRHANGRDYWIIVHGWNSNEFRCYLFTATGLALVPVVSAVGAVYSGGFPGSAPFALHANATGYLRASPNGHLLAAASRTLLELFAFDNLTGQVSSPQGLALPVLAGSSDTNIYGLEFSVDNTKLYVTEGDAANVSHLYQLDLLNNAAVTSLYTVPSTYLYRLGAVARGPDGQIYLAQDNTPALSVITSPNAAGLACNFQLQAVPLDTGRPGRLSQIGLPNLPNEDDARRLSVSGQLQGCVGTYFQFSSVLGAALAGCSLRWTFGDPTTGPANTATGRTPGHVYRVAGTYSVTVVATTPGGEQYTATQLVVVSPLPTLSLGARQQWICPSQSLWLTASPQLPGTTYRWRDGSGQGATRQVSQPGRYVLQVTAPTGCTVQDSVEIVLFEQPRISLGDDTALCVGSVRLRPNVQPRGSTYRWQDGSTAASFVAHQPGLYSVEVRTADGCRATAFRRLTFFDCPDQLPNIITPDGDAQNQSFVLKGLNAADWSLHLYNRWGREIYQQDQYDNSWAAQGQASGLYYYLLRNPTTGQQYKGWLEVVR